MPELTRYWNGSVFGTNTGRVNLEFTQQEGGLGATLRFMDDATGVVEYQLVGNRADNGHIILDSTTATGQEGVAYGNLHIEGDLAPDSTIRGIWRTNLHTGGNYILNPFVSQEAMLSGMPQQIVTKRVYLGFIQIYRDDVVRIAENIKRDFPIGRIIVTFNHLGTEGTTFYEDFLNIPDLRRLNYLKLTVNEPEGNGFNRIITMELRSYGLNEIMIQGSQEAWVAGRAVMMESLMKDFSDNIRDTTVRFSGPLQILLFIGFIIIVSGNIPLTEKLQWATGTFVVVQILPWLVQRLFPRAIIVMGEGKTHWLKRLALKGGTWLVGLFFASLGALITKYGDKILEKIDLLINTLVGNSPT